MRYAVVILLSIVLVPGLQGCFTVRSTGGFTYCKVSPAVYDSLLRVSGDRYLIDVRTPGEYDRSHMAGARNYDFFAFHYGEDVDTLDRSRTAFLYCQTCHRSPFAARIMKHKGFRCVYDLRGGYAAWQHAHSESSK